MGEIDAVLFTTGCPKCNVLKRKLDDAGVKYKTIEDPELMIGLGITSAPTLRVDGKYYDFSEAIEWVRSRE